MRQLNLALRSQLLEKHGFLHGFSTRAGGVSQPPFDALNLGRAVGDNADSVRENHRRLALEIGYDVARLFETSQVHGASVRLVDSRDDDVALMREESADALVTTSAGDAIGIRTADCTPILIADPESGGVAAIHAGWRGVVAGVVAAGVRTLEEACGATASRFIVAIGPCIRAASFEVGDEVAAQIAAVAHGADVVIPRVPRPHVDMVRAVVAQLEALGIPGASIDDLGVDTFAEPARFFSHRRDAHASGRHLSVIVAG
jgi:YfiH family protein